MTILQIYNWSNLFNYQSFIDNFLWPLILLIVTFIGGIIWNLFIRKKFHIDINQTDTYIGVHNGQNFLIINLSLINNTQEPINGLILTTKPTLSIKKGVFISTAADRLQGGGFLMPLSVNLIQDIILDTPMIINSVSSITGNVVIEINNTLLQNIELSFTYLNKCILKDINITNLDRRLP